MNVSELIEKLGRYDGSMEVVAQYEGVQSTFDSGCFSINDTAFDDTGEESLVIYVDGDV